MDLFTVIEMTGGLALFLFGMNVMSASLKKVSGSRLEATLQKMTSNPLKGIALGAGITAMLQSSSAMTVMLVGLVNSGVMKLSQTIPVIMGSNIGKTTTTWLLSLSGIRSDNVFMNLLKPRYFAPILTMVGVIMSATGKRQKKRDAGTVLTGFGVLMLGMVIMSSSMSVLQDDPAFLRILTVFNNPLLGLLVGMVFTAIIQSSAASVGILQALSSSIGITYQMAMPIVLGQNIGTCITSVIAALGVKNKDAKRVSMVHVLFNVLGAAVFMILLYGGNAFFSFAFFGQNASPAGIALFHSVFNIVTTLLFLPFQKALEKLARAAVKDGTNERERLDPLLLSTPAIALEQATNVTNEMLDRSIHVLLSSLELVNSFDEEKAEMCLEEENEIDLYEDDLGTYLIELSSRDLTEQDSHDVSMLLEDIVDIERISDHAANIVIVAQNMDGKEIVFSDQALREFRVLHDAVEEILCLVRDAFTKHDYSLAQRVEPLEQVIDALRAELSERHTQRLKTGRCTMETGIYFLDILNNIERVSDHCSNIAVNLMRIDKKGIFDAHSYLDRFKTEDRHDYNKHRDEYAAKYTLPGISEQ